MEPIVCEKLVELPKKNMRAYRAAEGLEKALQRHAELGGKPAVKVYQFGGAFYVDVDVEEKKHE